MIFNLVNGQTHAYKGEGRCISPSTKAAVCGFTTGVKTWHHEGYSSTTDFDKTQNPCPKCLALIQSWKRVA